MILSDTQEKIVERNKNKKSNVWIHFEKTDSQTVSCNLCGKVVKSCGNTSNLRQHLKLRHGAEFMALSTSSSSTQQNRIQQSYNTNYKIENSEYRFKVEREPDSDQSQTMTVSRPEKIMTVRMKNTKSNVWKFFKKDSSQVASCDICGKLIKSSGNTSNLRQHLKQRHTEAFNAVITMPTLQQPLSFHPELMKIEARPDLTEGDSYQDQSQSLAFYSQEEEILLQKKYTKSNVWKYFKKHSSLAASCDLCSKLVKSNGNTSNLRQHLRQRHNTVFEELNILSNSSQQSITSYSNLSDLKSRPDLSQSSQDIDQCQKVVPQNNATELFLRTKMSNTKSDVWQYFQKMNLYTVSCDLCGKFLQSSGNTSNLRAHLRQKHNDVFTALRTLSSSIQYWKPRSCNSDDASTLSETDKELDNSPGLSIPRSNMSTGNKSNVWKYFQKINPTTASCDLCGKLLKSSGNTSNLRQHLRQKHRAEFIALGTRNSTDKSYQQEPYTSNYVLEDSEATCDLSEIDHKAEAAAGPNKNNCL